MSIKQLKDLIYGLEGYPQDIQRLIYNGKQVQDSSTLSDCGADFGAVFHLVQRLRGGGDAQGKIWWWSAGGNLRIWAPYAHSKLCLHQEKEI